MEVVYGNVCGLDVHKRTVVACVRRLVSKGRIEQEVRTFGTMTRELMALLEWLRQAEVTHVAMESTGVFWKPVYNILEGHVQVLLVNAKHIKQVPGRKTDVKDCQWIAQLLQCGLLRASFVPQRLLREMRDLTRHRAKLVQQHTAVGNRLQAVLEDANIKLSSVASDVLGVSGRAMIQAIIDGNDNAEELAELARRRLREKLPELRVALQGKVTEHHRYFLKMLLEQLTFIERAIEQIDHRIAEVSSDSFRQAVRLLTTMPGVGQRTAENVLAEIGTEMDQFPSEKHLCSWAGVSPGNDESAGKRRSGKTPKANHWLRRALGEAAWAAARSKDTYLRAQFHRIAARRGKKRAIVAVGHTLLATAYYMLRLDRPYSDLGANHFERMNTERLTRYHVKKLQALGHEVTLAPLEQAA
jgi:transposase